MHSKGAMHRDLKPANIMYCEEKDQLKICDFGLSRTTYEWEEHEDILIAPTLKKVVSIEIGS